MDIEKQVLQQLLQEGQRQVSLDLNERRQVSDEVLHIYIVTCYINLSYRGT